MKIAILLNDHQLSPRAMTPEQFNILHSDAILIACGQILTLVVICLKE